MCRPVGACSLRPRRGRPGTRPLPREPGFVPVGLGAVPMARRRTSGSVSPWPTSVTRITANVSSRMRFRSGNVAGSASAAASETAPRRPGPADDEGQPPGEARVAPRDHPPRRSGQEAGREDPDEAGRRRPPPMTSATRPRTSAGRARPEPREDLRQLQADQDEHEAVEDEPDHLPGAQPQDPAARRQDRPETAADDEAGGDGREDARQVEADRREGTRQTG